MKSRAKEVSSPSYKLDLKISKLRLKKEFLVLEKTKFDFGIAIIDAKIARLEEEKMQEAGQAPAKKSKLNGNPESLAPAAQLREVASRKRPEPEIKYKQTELNAFFPARKHRNREVAGQPVNPPLPRR